MSQVFHKGAYNGLLIQAGVDGLGPEYFVEFPSLRRLALSTVVPPHILAISSLLLFFRSNSQHNGANTIHGKDGG